MAEEVVYQCVKCGGNFPLKEWERGGVFKCPACSFRVGMKVRPPIVRKVKAV